MTRKFFFIHLNADILYLCVLNKTENFMSKIKLFETQQVRTYWDEKEEKRYKTTHFYIVIIVPVVV